MSVARVEATMAKKKKGSGAMTKGVGAAVLIAFLLGMYTGIPGFGGGDGAAGNAGTEEAAAGGPVDATTDLDKTGLEDNVATVLIDGSNYAVLTKDESGTDKYTAASLQQIVSLATQAKGDDTGVRVKVLRRETSMALTEVELRNALLAAGISETSMYWPKQFAP